MWELARLFDCADVGDPDKMLQYSLTTDLTV